MCGYTLQQTMGDMNDILDERPRGMCVFSVNFQCHYTSSVFWCVVNELSAKV